MWTSLRHPSIKRGEVIKERLVNLVQLPRNSSGKSSFSSGNELAKQYIILFRLSTFTQLNNKDERST